MASIFKCPGGYRGKVQYRDSHGRPKSKWLRGSTRKEVREKANRFLETRVLEVADPDMSVAQLCRMAVLRAEEKGCAPNTVRGYLNFTNSHIVPAVGRLKVADLRASHVERMMDGMGTSRQTKLLVRAFLRMAINKVAIKAGVVSRNEASLADPPRRAMGGRSRIALTPDSLQLILAAEQNPVRRCLYLVVATTGLRISEARFLTWNEIKERPDGMWIHLNRSKTNEGLKPVPLSDATWREIQALGKSSVVVFPSAKGTPINETNLRRSWLVTLDRAGLPATNIYQLRKLFGSVHARNVSDSILKRLMRHTDARTTKQFYVDAFDEDLRKAVES